MGQWVSFIIVPSEIDSYGEYSCIDWIVVYEIK